MQWSEWTSVIGDLNYLAIIAASALVMILGSAWYASSVFGKQWLRLTKLKDIGSSDMTVTMGGSFALTLISAWGLSILVHLLAITQAADGFIFGLFIGLLFVSTGWLTNYLFERKPVELWKINAGYATLGLGIMGAVLAIWR